MNIRKRISEFLSGLRILATLNIKIKSFRKVFTDIHVGNFPDVNSWYSLIASLVFEKIP